MVVVSPRQIQVSWLPRDVDDDVGKGQSSIIC